MRYAGMGFEFGAAIAGFALLGWWIDRHWQIEGNKALLICAAFGLVGGMYNFIRQALIASRESVEEMRRERDRHADDSENA